MKTIPVPADLPPTAALALWEWLADLEQAVWTHYESDLLPLLVAETATLTYTGPEDDPGGDDDIPFPTDPEDEPY